MSPSRSLELSNLTLDSSNSSQSLLSPGLPSGTPKLPLSFGVEFEFLFCVNGAIKNRDSLHNLFISENDPRHPDDQGSHTPSQDPFHARIARLLRNKGLPIRVLPEPKMDDTRYEHWTVTHEPYSDLSRTFWDLVAGSEGKVTEATLHEWETKGMELVSRVLTAPEPDYKAIHPSISECGNYLGVLKSGSTDWFLIVRPDNSSLHVHLAIHPDTKAEPTSMKRVPLKVLKHLAYILIEYEDVISSFHHRERRGYLETKTYSVAESNRFGVYGNMHACGKPPEEGLKAVEHQIFKQTALRGLTNLLDNETPYGEATRMKFVNWENLSRATSKTPTIEFRQHHGTLDFMDVRHWVTFIVALFRAAERKADQPTPPVSPQYQSREVGSLAWSMGQGKKYNTRYESQEQRRDALFELLGLDRLARRYWMARWDKYCLGDAARG